ncbi:MAG: AraC family transcriptional regulator [Paenibacillaceae bacterium]|jgi:YesN/AraC family two-component response regulator|nr:AraC family transcriptional regulator [Paenibacillaceae bacterium]
MPQDNVVKYLSKDETFFLHYNTKHSKADMHKHHIHDNYEVYYLIAGERGYFINDTLYTVKKGDLVIIPKYVLHRTINTGVPSHERVVINFKDAFIQRFLSQELDLLLPFRQSRFKLSLNVPGQNFVENLFHRMLKEIKTKPFGFETVLKTLTIDLLVFIRRCMEEYEWEQTSSASPLHEKISEIAGYINANYSEPITLSAISSRFYISPSYLSRVFKEVSGFSFIEYVNMVRVKEAQKMLRETKWKVIFIAEKVGFNQIAHFGRVFKTVTKFSPSQYRNMSRGKAASQINHSYTSDANLSYSGYVQTAALSDYADKLRNGGEHAYFEDDQVSYRGF